MNRDRIIGIISLVAAIVFLIAASVWADQPEVVHRTPPQQTTIKSIEGDQCQYPNRPLDPEGRCDNSDPCDPTTIDGKCKDDPTGSDYDPNWDPQTNKPKQTGCNE